MSEQIDREVLEEALRQAKISHTWMLESIQHKEDETSGGNYSPELKHAIASQKMLEKRTQKKEGEM